MKRIFTFIALAAALAIGASSCQKDEPAKSDKSQDGTIELTITGEIGELTSAEGTKSTLQNTPHMTWSNSDKVFVYESTGTTCLGALSVAALDNEDKIAKLSGKITDPGTEATLVFIHVSSNPDSAPEVSEGKVSIDLSNQSSDIFVLKGSIENYDQGTTPSALYVNFEFATSVVRAVVTGLPANTSVTQAQVASLNTKCQITLSDASVAGATSGTITKTCTDKTTNASGQAVIDIAVVATEASTTDRKITFTAGGTTYPADFTKNAIATKTSYVTAVDACLLGAHDYVVIGGKKWATMNIGATTVGHSPETCFGDYFAWGATSPWYIGGLTYSWSSNTWTTTANLKKSGGYSDANAPYYNSSSYTKYTDSDSKTKLEDADDVAHQLWGGNWRMPTKDDFVALRNACTGGTGENSSTPQITSSTAAAPTDGGVYFLTYNQTVLPYNVAGLLFIDKNDTSKRVFFPAAGGFNGTSFYNGGTYGNYWSSSLITDNDNYAYRLHFSSSGVYPAYDYSRYYGISVRPVAD